jgi:hypothetical protein
VSSPRFPFCGRERCECDQRGSRQNDIRCLVARRALVRLVHGFLVHGDRRPSHLLHRAVRRQQRQGFRAELADDLDDVPLWLSVCGADLAPKEASAKAMRIRLHAGKHFPKATSSLSGPCSRIVRRSNAQTTLFSFFKKPSHVFESAVTCKSGWPTCPSCTAIFLSRITMVACRCSSPVGAGRCEQVSASGRGRGPVHRNLSSFTG